MWPYWRKCVTGAGFEVSKHSCHSQDCFLPPTYRSRCGRSVVLVAMPLLHSWTLTLRNHRHNKTLSLISWLGHGVTTIERWLRWGGSLGRDGEYWRATTRSWVRAGCWSQSLGTKTRYPSGCFATQKRTTKQLWGPLASFCAGTMSKSVLPPFYSIQQAASLKLARCWNGRVHDLLVNSINDFRGHSNDHKRTNSITRKLDCWRRPERWLQTRVPQKCTGTPTALGVS